MLTIERKDTVCPKLEKKKELKSKKSLAVSIPDGSTSHAGEKDSN